MIVPLVVVGVLVLAVLVVLGAFVITRQAVAAAATALAREVPADETVVARAAANCLSGGARGMGTLVVTDRALRFRGTRASETMIVPRPSITVAEARADGSRHVLAVEWRDGAATWRMADPAPVAATLST